MVKRRLAAHKRLQDAVNHRAGIAVLRDPFCKAEYAALRARGHRHACALRSHGDRLIAVACAMPTSPNEHFASTQMRDLRSVPTAASVSRWRRRAVVPGDPRPSALGVNGGVIMCRGRSGHLTDDRRAGHLSGRVSGRRAGERHPLAGSHSGGAAPSVRGVRPPGKANRGRRVRPACPTSFATANGPAGARGLVRPSVQRVPPRRPHDGSPVPRAPMRP